MRMSGAFMLAECRTRLKLPRSRPAHGSCWSRMSRGSSISSSAASKPRASPCEAELDGSDGEQSALDESFDMVVLDLMLPGRGGLEILAALRQAKPRVPVIVLTAAGEIEDRVGGLDAGAVDYLVKPFSLAELAGASPGSIARGGADDRDDHAEERRHRGESTHPQGARRGDCRWRLAATEFELLACLLRHCGQCGLARADPQHRLGLPTRSRHQRRGRLRRLSPAQASRPGQPRPDLHRAQGRLPPRRWMRRGLARGRAALAPGRMGGGCDAGLHSAITFVAVYRGTGSELRQQIDQEIGGDSSELSHTLAASGDRSPKRVARAATRYVQAQPFSASSTLLFATVPGVRHEHQRPRAVHQREARQRRDGRPIKRRRTGWRRKLATVHDGYSTLRPPRRG